MKVSIGETCREAPGVNSSHIQLRGTQTSQVSAFQPLPDDSGSQPQGWTGPKRQKTHCTVPSSPPGVLF